MNTPAGQSGFFRSPSLANGVVAALRSALHSGAAALTAFRAEHAARSREVGAFDDLVEMDAHMLRDIGAPSWLISRAVGRRDAPADLGITRAWARLLTIAGMASFAAFSIWDAPAASACEPSAQQLVEAVFTGAVDRGTPVYRLPSITVSAKRTVELARRGADARREHRVRRDGERAPTAG